MEKELQKLLNKYSEDNKCNTPDFILAKYLIGCLDAFEVATGANIEWHSSWKTQQD